MENVHRKPLQRSRIFVRPSRALIMYYCTRFTTTDVPRINVRKRSDDLTAIKLNHPNAPSFRRRRAHCGTRVVVYTLSYYDIPITLTRIGFFLSSAVYDDIPYPPAQTRHTPSESHMHLVWQSPFVVVILVHWIQIYNFIHRIHCIYIRVCGQNTYGKFRNCDNTVLFCFHGSSRKTGKFSVPPPKNNVRIIQTWFSALPRVDSKTSL